MRVVIHAGQTKTGSTALQKVLSTRADELPDHGLCYPRRPGDGLNHAFLTPLVAAPEVWGQGARSLDAAHIDGYRLFLEGPFAEEARAARAAGLTTILSCEGFSAFDEGSLARLRDVALRFGERPEIVLYVRSPAGRFLSQLQQKLKTEPRLIDARTFASRAMRTHAALSAVFGDAVTMRTFQVSSLVGGDITRDFLDFVDRDHGLSLPAEPQRANDSLSAEAMAALWEIRRADVAAGTRGGPRRDARILAALRAEEADLPVSRPRLREEVRLLIDHRSRQDLRKLRRHFGIVFDDVDYGALDEPRPLPEAAAADLAELAVYDAGVAAEFVRRVRARLAGGGERERAAG